MIKIGLLFGGISTEHDISIITMYQIKEKIDKLYEVYPIYISKQGELFLANEMELENFKEKNYKKLKKIAFTKKGFTYKKKQNIIDAMIILNHGMNGEDGMSSALMEFYDIPYLGSNMYASTVTMDKGLTHQILKNYDVPIVEKQIYTKLDHLNDIPIKFDKCIIKPARLGSSIGISICKNHDEIKENLLEAFKYDNKVIIEELLEDFKEYNMALYKTDEIVYSYLEEVNKENEMLSFDDKYISRVKESTHKRVTDTSLEEEVKRISQKIYEIFDLSGIVRVDYMMKGNKIYFNEVNTIPGALSYYLFEDFQKDIEKLIKHTFIEYKKRNSLIRHYASNLFDIRGIKK